MRVVTTAVIAAVALGIPATAAIADGQILHATGARPHFVDSAVDAVRLAPGDDATIAHRRATAGPWGGLTAAGQAHR